MLTILTETSDQSSLDTYVKNDAPLTVLYFTATWCGPCKAFKPIMNEIQSEGYSVEIIDLDSNQALANQYNVRSVPTTVIEENGVEVDRFIGGLPKQSVVQKLNG